MIGDWIFDHLGICLVVTVLLILGMAYHVGNGMAKEKKEACAQMWSLTRTSRDSLDVIKSCNLPRRSSTIVVPMPIYIPTR